jgi:hypothetical protein
MAGANVALLAVTNEYISYTTTPEEYQAQNFEGAFTLYGPLETEFFKQKLMNTAQTMGQQPPPPLTTRTFQPGRKLSVPDLKKLGNKLLCFDQKLEVEKDPSGNIKRITFYWKDPQEMKFGQEFPTVKIFFGDGPLKNSYDVEESDQWVNMEVQCRRSFYWSAGWTPTDDCVKPGTYQFAVYLTTGETLYSEPFSLLPQ